MDELQQSLVLNSCVDYLAGQGITVSEVTDMRLVHDIVLSSEKDYITPILSPQFNDFTPANSLWLYGEHNGLPVLLGGARKEELGGMSVADYWPMVFRRLYGGGVKEIIRDVDRSIAREFCGNLAYFGDLHCARPGPKRLNSRAFTMIGHILTQQRFNADFTYAFVRRNEVMSGSSARFNFAHTRHKPFTWLVDVEKRSPAELLAWSTPDDLRPASLCLLDDLIEYHQEKAQLDRERNSEDQDEFVTVAVAEKQHSA